MNRKKSPPRFKFSTTPQQRRERWDQLFAKYEVPHEGEAGLELSMFEWEERSQDIDTTDRVSVRRSVRLDEARRNKDVSCNELNVTRLGSDLTQTSVKESSPGNKPMYKNGVLATRVDNQENWTDADCFLFGGKKSSGGKDLTVGPSGVLEVSRVPVDPEVKFSNVIGWLQNSPGPPRSNAAVSDVGSTIDRGGLESSTEGSVPVDHSGSSVVFPSASPAHRTSSAVRLHNDEAGRNKSRERRSETPTVVVSLSCSEITSPRYPALILPAGRRSLIAARPSFKSRRSLRHKDRRGSSQHSRTVSLGINLKSASVKGDSRAPGNTAARKLYETGLEADVLISSTTSECPRKTVSRFDSAKPREVAFVFKSEGVDDDCSYLNNRVEMTLSSLKRHVQSEKENKDGLSCIIEEDVKAVISDEKSWAEVSLPNKCHLKSDYKCFDSLSHDSFKDSLVMQVDVCDVSTERKQVKGSSLGTDVRQNPLTSKTPLLMGNANQSKTHSLGSRWKKSRMNSITDSVVETEDGTIDVGGSAKVFNSPCNSVKNIDFSNNAEKEGNVSRDSELLAARNALTDQKNKMATALNNGKSVVCPATGLNEPIEKKILPCELTSNKNSRRSSFSRNNNSLSAGCNKTNVTGIFDELTLKPLNVTPKWEVHDSTLSASRTIEFEIVNTSDEELIDLPPRFRKSIPKRRLSSSRLKRNHLKLLSPNEKKANATAGSKLETMQGNSVSAANELGLEMSVSSDRLLGVTRSELNSTGTKRGHQKKENTISVKLLQSVGSEGVTDKFWKVPYELCTDSKHRVDQNTLTSSVSKLIGLKKIDTTKLQSVSSPVNHLQETLSPSKNYSSKDLQVEERVDRISLTESANKVKHLTCVKSPCRPESLMQRKIELCTSDSNKTHANMAKKISSPKRTVTTESVETTIIFEIASDSDDEWKSPIVKSRSRPSVRSLTSNASSTKKTENLRSDRRNKSIVNGDLDDTLSGQSKALVSAKESVVFADEDSDSANCSARAKNAGEKGQWKSRYEVQRWSKVLSTSDDICRRLPNGGLLFTSDVDN